MFFRNDIPKLKQDLNIQTNLLGYDLTLKVFSLLGVFMVIN
jgi:hypothetical protein